jgi:ATP-dependent helicase/nuclease subunit B
MDRGFAGVLDAAQEGATIVTASRRLARLLRERYNGVAKEHGRVAWVAPQILPWSAWLGELWEAALYSDATGSVPIRLGPEQERVVWERIIAGSPDADELLQIPATAAAVAEAWKLMHSWRLDRAFLEAHANEDTLAFLGWAREFESACASAGWIDGARLADDLAPRLSALRLPSRIVLAGFDEIDPQQNDFLEACRRVGADVRIAEPALAATAPRAVRFAFEETSEEIAAVARWARALLEDGSAGIGVVIRGLDRMRSKVERGFTQVFDPGSMGSRPLFNISAGPPLASYPLVHAALLALDLTPGTNEFDLVSRLLRSPFLGGAETEWTGRAALDARLRRFGGTTVSVGRVERFCEGCGCPVLAKNLAAWRRERDAAPAQPAPSEWARTFSTLLARLGWPGERALSSDDYQTVEAWRELLSEFASLETVLPTMHYEDALSGLRRMAGRSMFQPETPAAPVQILGALETAGLSFEHLWIAGMDDEAWPGPPKPAAFLPIALQRARQVPHSSPERELAFARKITGRLLSSAADVVVSHCRRQGDRQLGPSPLIRDVPEGGLAIPDYRSYMDVIRGASVVESLDDHTAPPVEGEAASGGTRVFQYQAMCPFRAFASLRLGAEPLEAPAPGLSAAERGTLVHHALAKIWKALESHARLCQTSAPEVEGIIGAAVRSAIAAVSERRGDPLPERFGALEEQRLGRILGGWMEAEKNRQPFTVIESEAEHYAVAGGVCARVKVDRVDRLEDGRDVIIDYKTGRPELRSWDGERPDEPQLPLYAVTHEGPVAAVVFAQLKTGELKFKGYADAESIVPGAEVRDMPAELAEWRSVLDRLGADFRAGVANVNPKDANACRRCSLLALCRFGELETPASAFDGDGQDA